MAMSFQVTVDCADPHALADWWAETLGWEVEPSDPDFIRSMVSQGHASEADTTTHRGVLVWRTGAAIGHPDGAGPAARMLFQLVPEGKTVKNRMHLDLRPGDGDADAVVARLLERGATFLHTGSEGPQSTWTTLADPEGNEFCVA
ncbi:MULTISPECIES: VOC family protein [unclassified Actinotalea]|uniref:VOC family protein n=1 Tax=unclassified Actinotalea TaxID=2638618 RepID=UPI0015F74F07|nr:MULTISPECIES: VOC family protein [unclassified Actinotalea]